MLRVFMYALLLGLTAGASALPKPGLSAIITADGPAKLTDLDAAWTRMILTYKPMAIAVSTQGNPETIVCYTKGHTIREGDGEYLVTYRAVVPKVSSMAGNSVGSASVTDRIMPKLIANTPLALALVDIRRIVEISAPSTFNLLKEVTTRISTGEAGSQDAGAAIQSAIMVPVLTKAREKALITETMANLKYIGMALNEYANSYDDVLPPMADAQIAKKALQAFVADPAMFQNPITKQYFHPNSRMSRKHLSEIADPASAVIYYDDPAVFDGKRAVLFMDDHVMRIDDGEWQHIKREQRIP